MDEKRRNEIGATVFAILTGLSALCFTGWLFTSGGCAGDRSKHEIVDLNAGNVPASQGYSKVKGGVAGKDGAATTELARIKSERDAALADINAEAARRAELAAEKADLQAKLDTYKAAFGDSAPDELKAAMLAVEKKAGEREVKLKKLEESHLQLEEEVEEANAEIKSLNGKLESLKGAKAELKASKEANVVLESKMADLRGQYDASTKASADLSSKLKAATDKAGAVDMANAETEKLRARITDLEKKLNDAGKDKLLLTNKADAMAADVKSAADKVAAAEKKYNAAAKAWTTEKQKLEAQAKALETSNAELRKQLQEMKKQMGSGASSGNGTAPAPNPLASAAMGLPELDLPFLVNDPAKLDPGSKDLFVNLRGIKESPEALEKAYAEISGDGKYKAALRIPFDSGSDVVSGKAKGQLDELVKKAGPGAKFLVVGYASTDGSNETNYTLSSQRASNVGKLISEMLDGKGSAQAVYFGQTSRFSEKKAPNRVVEVWQVK